MGRRADDPNSLEELPQTAQAGVDWRSWIKRLIPVVLVAGVVIGVGWWVRREGAYRRFLAEMREGNVNYIEFQPYPNLPFVKITNSAMIAEVADFLRGAQPNSAQFGTMVPVDCEMRIVMNDGTIRKLKIGQTGPMKMGGTLTPSGWWTPVEGEGWKRSAYSSTLSSVYMRLPQSAQLKMDSIPPPPVAITGAPQVPPASGPADYAWLEVNVAVAEEMMARGQLGQARRVIARGLVSDPNGPLVQKISAELSGTIRIRFPQLAKELEKELPENLATLSKDKYWQLREKLLELALIADPADRKIAELRQRLSNGRPPVDASKWHEMLRLDRGVIGEPVDLVDLAWSPDGATLAGINTAGAICVWDSVSGQMLARTNAMSAKKIVFSEDGKKIGIGADERKLVWWDALNLRRLTESADAAREVKSAYRVELRGTQTVDVLDKDGKPAIKLVGHAAKVKLAKFSGDGDQLVTFGEDRVASIWGEGVSRGIDELSPYEKFRQLQALGGPSVFARDGSILTLRAGPQKTGKEKAGQFDVFTFDFSSPLIRIESAANWERHLVELADGFLAVIEPEQIIPLARPKGWSGRAAIAADGKQFAQGLVDGSVKLIEVDGGKEVRTFFCSPHKARKWDAVALSSDGGWIMACGEGVACLWHAKSGEQLVLSDKAGVGGLVVGFRPDGSRAMMIDRGGGISFVAGKVQPTYGTGNGPPGAHDLVTSADGRWIATIGESSMVEIYDGAGGGFITQIGVKVRPNDRDAVRFSRDGKVVAIKCGDGFVRLIEQPSGRGLRIMKMVPEMKGWLDMPMSFSADGKYLIAGPMVWGME
jgi:WD40 repeat protein